jgi:hypothetical protein
MADFYCVFSTFSLDRFPPVCYYLDMKETVLYGKRKDSIEDWQEELLLTNATPELIEKVKVLAAKDGFHSFRVAEIDLNNPPDFGKTVVI